LRCHFTYVWGGHASRGSPITFTSKANRTLSIRNCDVGDLVFGVVSRNPSDPTVQIRDEDRGKLVSAWQVSHITADTADFGIEALSTWERTEDGGYRWPFALQPIRAWRITDAPVFREIAGYTPGTHTQRAVSALQEVEGEIAETLVNILKASGVELEVLMPRFKVTAAKVKKLRQRHPFATSGYSVEIDSNSLNSVYIATLGNRKDILKVGHSKDAKARVEGFNKFRMTDEPQWTLHTDQPIGTVEEAIEVENELGEIFARYRTEENNAEIYVGIPATDVLLKLANMKSQSN